MALIKLNNRGVRNVSAFGSVVGGSMTFIKKLTADGSGTSLSFVNGSSDVVLDSTYKEYLFTYNNIHPATNEAGLYVNFRDGGSSYDATKTTTIFVAEHKEDGSGGALNYDTGGDLAQSTAAQKLTGNIGNDNDQSSAGYLHLFNPSSTTFVKHFIGVGHEYQGADYANVNYVAGYCNVTAAIDGVQFSMSSGNMDAGDICLYGIK